MRQEHLVLLELAKRVACESAQIILASTKAKVGEIESVSFSGRETKIVADRILNEIILNKLAHTGISVLSEESGYIDLKNHDGLLWIVDPLDGSLNFCRGSGPSAISIALWKDMCPYFGVIFSLSDNDLVWGGMNLGAWVDEEPIKVSTTKEKEKATLCTGIPTRFNYHDSTAVKKFNEMIFGFSKVRMIGSAACSLLLVASGAADIYWEEDIMLWDIAAGLAIVEGAGGHVQYESRIATYQYSTIASNSILIDRL